MVKCICLNVYTKMKFSCTALICARARYDNVKKNPARKKTSSILHVNMFKQTHFTVYIP